MRKATTYLSFLAIIFVNVCVYAQSKEIYILEGNSMTFKVGNQQNARWYYQPSEAEPWDLVNEGNVYTHFESQGKLFALIMGDSLTYQISDTITFVSPLANQGQPLIYKTHFYKTVKIGEHTWMAEDFSDTLYTYEEASEIARSIPGWGLPTLGWNKDATDQEIYSTSGGAMTDLLGLPPNGWLSESSLGLKPGEYTGFDFEPTGYETIENAPFFNDSSAYYWHDSYQGWGPIQVNNYAFYHRVSYHHPDDKFALRLVKESGSHNHPPDLPILLWPFDNLSSVDTDPLFSWTEAVDPDGDDVTYELNVNLHQTYANSQPQWMYEDPVFEGITTSDSKFQHALTANAQHQWHVVAVDAHGAARRVPVAQRAFTVAGNSETPVENPGAGNYTLGEVLLDYPEDDMHYNATQLEVKYQEYASDVYYKINVGFSDPPANAGATYHKNRWTYQGKLLSDTTYYWSVDAYKTGTHEKVASSEVRSFHTNEEIVATEDYSTGEYSDDPTVGPPITYQAGAGAEVTNEITLITPADNHQLYYGYLPTHEWEATITDNGYLRFYYRIIGKGWDPNWRLMIDRGTIGYFTWVRFHPWKLAIQYLVEKDPDQREVPKIEWKVVFYDTDLETETKQSETRTFFLVGEQLATPVINHVDDEKIAWDPVEHANHYQVTIKETFDDCSGGGYGNTSERQYTRTVTTPEIERPQCDDRTKSLSVTVKAFDYDWIYGESEYEPFYFLNYCTPEPCPERPAEGNVGDGGDGSSGSTGGGTGGGSSSLSEDNVYCALWQNEKSGKWYAAGQIQNSKNSLWSFETIEEAWDFVNYDNTYDTKSLVGQCGIFTVYLVPNRTPESVDYNVVQFLKNNGCEL